MGAGDDIEPRGTGRQSFVGGPLNFVQTGDEIEIDVDKRSIHLHVNEQEMARRKAAWKKPPPKYPRGYGAMFSEHIGQAVSSGCIRMTNEDVIDLYSKVKMGAIVVVTAPKQGDSPFNPRVANAVDRHQSY